MKDTTDTIHTETDKAKADLQKKDVAHEAGENPGKTAHDTSKANVDKSDEAGNAVKDKVVTVKDAIHEGTRADADKASGAANAVKDRSVKLLKDTDTTSERAAKNVER